jgi:hypothetical protein
VNIPLLSLTCTQAQRDRIHEKCNKNEKAFVSCSKTPSYIKVKSAILLHVGREAAREPLTSEDSELLKVSAIPI